MVQSCCNGQGEWAPCTRSSAQRSTDLNFWTDVGFTVYGQNDSNQADETTWMSLQVYTPPGGGPPQGPPAEPSYMFFITRDGDHTLVTFHSAVAGNGLVSAYVAQDWRFQAIPSADSLLILQPLRITLNGSPYHLVLWPNDGQALPVDPNSDPGPTPSDQADQDRLALLTGALAEVTTILNSPPSNPPVPTTGNGPGTGEYFRITEFDADSDDDGIFDSHEFNLGLSPVTADTDGDKVEDPWDGISTTLVVAEYQADNNATLPDEDGDYEDWVEILNPTSMSVSLAGWRLTAKAKFLGTLGMDYSQQDFDALWQFPNIELQPGASILIWASGKMRAVAGQPLHADFDISKTGDEIVLLNPQAGIADSHQWITLQVEDRSSGWGIDNFVDQADGRTRKLRFFGEPTPGALNKSPAYLGVCGKPAFSLPGGLYSGGSISVAISTQTSQSIRFTTNFFVPDESSELYSTALNITTTTIVRAQVSAPDCLPSPVVTASYLFKEDVLGTAAEGTVPTDQQVKPPQYTDETSQINSATNDWWRIDYQMDPLVIQAQKNTMLSELTAIPSVSLVLPPADFFDKSTGGIYANASVSEDDSADPLGTDWRRLVSVEYLIPDPDPNDPSNGPKWYQENARISIAGASSIEPETTPKHGMKIEFRKSISSNPEGVMIFDEEPLPGSILKKFRTFMLRNPSQDSWLVRNNATPRAEATYVKETWARSIHAAMGLAGGGQAEHPIAHRRWVHLYVDGLYWGVYEFGERINEDYLQAYSQADAQFDVIKTHSVPENGNTVAWSALGARAALAAQDPNNASKWTDVTEMIDLNNYIDYLLVNMFAHNWDWPHNNWRIARRKDLDDRTDPNNVVYASGAQAQRFQFFIWDAELTLLSAFLPLDKTGASAEVAGPHIILLGHSNYQQAWSDRVALHFDQPGGVFYAKEEPVGSGNWIDHAASASFGGVAEAFQSNIFCESARWGDTTTLPAPASGLAEWLLSTASRSTWLEDRRAIILEDLQIRGLAN